MALNFTVARPYAKAIFEQASADNKLQEWHGILQCLVIIAEDPQMNSLLIGPKLSDEQKVSLFSEVSQAALGDMLQPLIEKLIQFLTLLANEKRLVVLTEIAEIYKRLLAIKEGIIEVDVISAEAMEEAQCKAINSALEKRLQSKISINYKQNADLIGGLLIRAGNWVMDGSIKGKLARLSETIC